VRVPEISPLFHVGYHKTGTTWMQRRLLVAAAGYAPAFGHEAVHRLVTGPHPLAFDPAPARSALADAAAAAPEGAVPVVSSEILSGHPFYGGRESAEFAARLAAIAPEARILLTVRAQIPAIASVYMQYVRRGGRLPAARFFEGAPGIGGFPGFDPVHFEYHRLVERYRALFGAERVLVLTQEALAADPAGFAARLAAFSGARGETPCPAGDRREGASEPQAAAAVLRRINAFARAPAGPDPVLDLGGAARLAARAAAAAFRSPPGRALGALGAGGRPVTARAAARFSGRFAASNRALAALCPGLELPGYEL